jgi:hypothetical protein
VKPFGRSACDASASQQQAGLCSGCLFLVGFEGPPPALHSYKSHWAWRREQLRGLTAQKGPTRKLPIVR